MQYGSFVNVPEMIQRVEDGSYFEELAAKQEIDRKRRAESEFQQTTVPSLDGWGSAVQE
jgi:hypothetical protein